MKKEELKMVVFDFDGVILDSEPMHARAVSLVLERHGVMDFDPMQCVGMSAPLTWERLIKEYGLAASVKELMDETLDADDQLLRASDALPSAGLREVLDTLGRMGVRTGIASSSMARYVRGALSFLGLTERFPVVVTGDECDRKKPFADPYLLAASRGAAPPVECAAVEDSAIGVESAKSAGLFCVGYRNPTSGEQDLSHADVVIEHLSDLLPVFFGPRGRFANDWIK